jgi:hypothetical protein
MRDDVSYTDYNYLIRMYVCIRGGISGVEPAAPLQDGTISHLKSPRPIRIRYTVFILKSVLVFRLYSFPSIQGFSQELFEQKLLSFIICTDQPFSVVESTEFGSLLKFCNPEAHLIGRNAIRSRIKSLFERERSILQNKLKVHLPFTIAYI